MKIKGTQQIEVEVSRKDLADAIQNLIIEDYFDNDLEDKGSVWYTDEEGFRVYIDSEDNLIATDREVAALTDAMNILRYESLRKIENI
jgi:hypothetical protein